MYMKLVVHIGDIKTGSTSIQTALAARMIPQTGQSLHYPCDTLNHNFLEPLFRTHPTVDSPQIKKIRKSMKKNASADVCVISAERFSTLTPHVMERTLSNCFGDMVSAISILHYIRPHFGRAVSAYAEQVKIGASKLSLSEFLDKAIKEKRFHSATRIRKWREVFGPAYSVRVMSKNTMINQDVVADFFSAVLGKLPPGWSSPSQVNASLCAEGTEYVKALQSQLDGRLAALRHAVGYEFEYLYNKATPAAHRSRLSMNGAMATTFYDSHVNDAIEVDRRLGISVMKTELDRDYQNAISRQETNVDYSNRAIADKIISDLLDIAICADDKALATTIRKSRFKRMISSYQLAMGSVAQIA
jgi:hypothetical protein